MQTVVVVEVVVVVVVVLQEKGKVEDVVAVFLVKNELIVGWFGSFRSLEADFGVFLFYNQYRVYLYFNL